MSLTHRDYLGTIKLLPTSTEVSFWEEEICFILDRKRDRQISHFGNSAEYLKELLIRSRNFSLQERLLQKAIENTIVNFRFREAINNIEEKFWSERIYILTEITREFCYNNKKLVEIFVTLSIKLIDKVIPSLIRNSKNIDSDIISILTNILFLINDFLPQEIDLKREFAIQNSEFKFLIDFIKVLNNNTQEIDDFLINVVLFFFKIDYPLAIHKDALNRLISKPNMLKSIIFGISKYPNYAQEIYSLISSLKMTDKFWHYIDELELTSKLKIEIINPETNADNLSKTNEPEVSKQSVDNYIASTVAGNLLIPEL